MAGLWGCIHAEEVVIWGKEITACTHKHDKAGIGVIILEGNLAQISLIIAELLLFMKYERYLHFQGLRM